MFRNIVNKTWQPAAVLFALLFASASVHADSVVVLRASGNAPAARLEQVTEVVVRVIGELGHAVQMPEPGVLPPATAAEQAAFAATRSATYVLTPVVREVSETGYWLTLRVAYAPGVRIEEMDAEVKLHHEAERLRLLLQGCFRPGGISAESLAAAGEDAAVAPVAPIPSDLPPPALSPPAITPTEVLRVEPETPLPAYGEDAEWLAQVGFAVRPLLLAAGPGGVTSTVEARLGRSLAAVPNLELRVGFDAMFGAVAGIGIRAGAVYLIPIANRLFLGPSIEMGMMMALSGNRVPAFSARASAVLSWNMTGLWYLEASLPELEVWTSNGGVLLAGGSVRFGRRF